MKVQIQNFPELENLSESCILNLCSIVLTILTSIDSFFIPAAENCKHQFDLPFKKILSITYH